MKIEGSIETAILNMKYYMRVSSEGKNLSYDTLYNTFFNQFMRDEIKQLNIEREELYGDDIISENSLFEIKDLENQNNELEIEDLLRFLEEDNLENENVSLEMESVSYNEDVNESFKPSTFLNLVQNIAKPENDKPTQQSAIEIVHGIFIDEWQPCLKDYTSNGIFIDTWRKHIKENLIRFDEIFKKSEKRDIGSKLVMRDTVPYGIFIDEWVKPEKLIDESSEDFPLEDFTFEDDVVEDTIEEELPPFDEFTESIPSSIDELESKKEEVVVVPTNIRDFIKANQGAEVSYVLKYYKKKDIDKAVALGKIYKKFGKLYV